MKYFTFSSKKERIFQYKRFKSKCKRWVIIIIVHPFYFLSHFLHAPSSVTPPMPFKLTPISTQPCVRSKTSLINIYSPRNIRNHIINNQNIFVGYALKYDRNISTIMRYHEPPNSKVSNVAISTLIGRLCCHLAVALDAFFSFQARERKLDQVCFAELTHQSRYFIISLTLDRLYLFTL